ncbi:hypothetical protein GQ55_9G287800 [Panicum hallii var. hallii]|uniref:Uncharacterized protein n=1 Tax=Panicum hallii var. hallii TaxID=1504633 RepID=A0A2T7C7W6_9POAL|nr:hypothetical protein GQ55_9G287800 [Panicum hallii var. hallii]
MESAQSNGVRAPFGDQTNIKGSQATSIIVKLPPLLQSLHLSLHSHVGSLSYLYG